MISAILFINLKGEIIISRYYRDNVGSVETNEHTDSQQAHRPLRLLHEHAGQCAADDTSDGPTKGNHHARTVRLLLAGC
jgi:hypothetical protein